MKVGDMVKYNPHEGWPYGGLGTIVDIKADEIQVVWLDDIEDFGWLEALDTQAKWYGPEDLDEDIDLAVEAS
jgi:hypothetical protein